MKNLALINIDNMEKIVHRKTNDYYISKDKHIIYCAKTGNIVFAGRPFTRKDINKYIYQDLLKRKKKRK